MPQKTLSRREQFFKTSIRFRTIVFAVEDGNLQTDFGSISALRSIHDTMRRRLRILTGLQEIQRLKEHAAQSTEISDQLVQLRIISGRKMPGVLKRRVQIELESNVDDAA